MAAKATADKTALSLHTQIVANLHGQEVRIDLIAGSADELLNTVLQLQSANTGEGNGPAPTSDTAPAAAPSTPEPAPTPATTEKAPTSAPTAPAEPAPAPSATPAPSPAPAPAQAETPAPAVSLEDVYAKARLLLATGPEGETKLKALLDQAGAANISTLPEQYYQWAHEQISALGV